MTQAALILTPHTHWGLTLAHLYCATSNGVTIRLQGLFHEEDVEMLDISASSSTFIKLLRLMDNIRPTIFYQLAGKRDFKHERDFWEKADEPIQRYVRQLAAKRLAEIIRLAYECQIEVYYDTEHQREFFKKRAMRISLSEPQPCMHFQRTDEGVRYKLTLQIDDNIIHPKEHEIKVLTDRPGIVAIDKVVYLLHSHFSGKLLLPFCNKEVVEVPKRMENDYFHRFILKNAAAANIEAEGFELKELDVVPRCQLLQEQDTLGNSLLSIVFRYGDRTLTTYDKQQRFVRLEETEDGYRFLQITRDAAWEQHCLQVIQQESEGTNLNSAGIAAMRPNLNNRHLRFPSAEEMVAWLRLHGAVLREAGIEVDQPTDLRYYLGKMDWQQQVEQKGDWLLIHAYIALEDGRQITLSELRETLLAGKQEHTLPDGTVLMLPKEWVERYAPLVAVGQIEGTRLRVHYTQVAGQQAAAIAVDIPDDLPLQLKATLRPYQEVGYRWMLHHLAANGGCCLSDEMGLGKTLQTIALLLRYKEVSRRPSAPAFGMLFSEEEMCGKESPDGTLPQRTSLVLAPTSVVYNWRSELQRFAPSLSVMVYTGTPEERRRKREALTAWDVVVTTYRTLANDIQHLSRLSFGILVMDECQAFKSRDSQLHKAVSRLQGICHIALSGTPVENGLAELWSLMHIIQPSLLGSYPLFSHQYMQPIHHSLESVRTEMLRRMVAPYMLKRTKEEVLTDLPERQDELVVCPLSPEQESLYAAALSKARNNILENGEHQSVHVLTAIQTLRQLACHPLLVEEGASAVVATEKQQEGEEQTVKQTPSAIALSGKMEEVFHRLEALRGTSHKVLLFSEYVRFLHLIGKEMDCRGWSYEMLTGETQQREAVIQRFQQNETCQFFLISLKAGGVGLNLTEADYVFLLDPWWNRAAEEQAIGRSHRIGQHRSVFVYRFVSEQTLEQQVLTVQEDKQNIIDAVLPFLLHQGSPSTSNNK